MRSMGTNTWFSSDWHLGHANIVRYTERWRWYAVNGYPAAQDWVLDKSQPVPIDLIDEVIVERWNTRVKPEDVAVVVGDVALTKIAESLELVKRMNGRKILVSGNHDACFSHLASNSSDPAKLERRRQKYLDGGFSEVVDSMTIEMGGISFDVSHFPFVGESVSGIEDRHPAARPKPAGRHLICGHVHEAWKAQSYGELMMVNVGCDAWGGYPIQGSTLIGLVESDEDVYEIDSWL